jgi:hypothetical protein
MIMIYRLEYIKKDLPEIAEINERCCVKSRDFYNALDKKLNWEKEYGSNKPSIRIVGLLLKQMGFELKLKRMDGKMCRCIFGLRLTNPKT